MTVPPLASTTNATAVDRALDPVTEFMAATGRDPIRRTVSLTLLRHPGSCSACAAADAAACEAISSLGAEQAVSYIVHTSSFSRIVARLRGLGSPPILTMDAIVYTANALPSAEALKAHLRDALAS